MLPTPMWYESSSSLLYQSAVYSSRRGVQLLPQEKCICDIHSGVVANGYFSRSDRPSEIMSVAWPKDSMRDGAPTLPNLHGLAELFSAAAALTICISRCVVWRRTAVAVHVGVAYVFHVWTCRVSVGLEVVIQC